MWTLSSTFPGKTARSRTVSSSESRSAWRLLPGHAAGSLARGPGHPRSLSEPTRCALVQDVDHASLAARGHDTAPPPRRSGGGTLEAGAFRDETRGGGSTGDRVASDAAGRHGGLTSGGGGRVAGERGRVRSSPGRAPRDHRLERPGLVGLRHHGERRLPPLHGELRARGSGRSSPMDTSPRGRWLPLRRALPGI